MPGLCSDTIHLIHRRWQALLIFHLFFAGLTVAVLSPAMAWLLAAVQPSTGRAAITAGGLVEFLTSAGGLLWVALALAMAFLLLVLQQAGLILIGAIREPGPYRAVISSLWILAGRIRPLLGVTGIQVLAHGFISFPFLAAEAFVYHALIGAHDVHYLRTQQPPELWYFLASSGVIAAGFLCINAWLYLRLVLSVPLVVLEQRAAWPALRGSIRLMRGCQPSARWLLQAGIVVLFTMPLLVAFLLGQGGGLLLAMLPDRSAVIVPAVFLYLVVYTALLLVAAFAGMALYSTLVHVLFRRLSGKDLHPVPVRYSRRRGGLAWAVEIGVVCLAFIHAGWVIASFDQRDEVLITAHRGSSVAAPENTLAAIEQAIRDGADYVEVDVRLTGDGVPVLWHDADTRRFTSENRRVSEMTLSVLREIDLGGSFSPYAAGERAATLEAAMDRASGRIGLYLDLKPDENAPELVRSVVELLQARGMVEGTVIAAASTVPLLEAKRLEPALTTALLAQFVVGPINASEIDIIALRSNRVTPARIAEAHHRGRQLHVWTVNRARSMSRFVDMGVDNIITDRPARAVRLLEERAELNEAERLMIQFDNWLRSPGL